MLVSPQTAFVLGVSAAVGWGVISKLVIPFAQLLVDKFVSARFERGMEEFKYGVRVKEQAAKTAEYLALGFRLDSSDEKDIFARANQVGWELALYLPPEVYRHVRDAIAQPSDDRNLTTAIIEVRKYLLSSDAGDLTADDIAIHVPNARAIMAANRSARS